MNKQSLGVYIHIPFCVKKCNYCDFASFTAQPDEQAYYIRLLMKEIRNYEVISNLYRVSTVFIGGGTPSILPPELIGDVFKQLKNVFEWEENPEITIECNPGTLTIDKLSYYKELGINRLSIGLQSIHEEELKILGRIHTYEDFLISYYNARKVGFNNINIDLMSGLPKQKIDDWAATLGAAAKLDPEHISAYGLQIEEGTPFFTRYGGNRGKNILPTEDEDRAMYHYTKRYLEQDGYQRYEISNYCKKGKECRHNLRYWLGGDYLGLGLNASSYIQGRRFTNPRDKNEYKDTARNAYSVFKNAEEISQKEKMEEYMFLGLRTVYGVSENEFRRRFGCGFPDFYRRVILEMTEKGLMEKVKDNIRLTDAGIDVSNYVMAQFMF